MNNDPSYEKYFPFKDTITRHLNVKFPYAKSALLVYEIQYQHHCGDDRVPLLFDKYGAVDFFKTCCTYPRGTIENFLDMFIL